MPQLLNRVPAGLLSLFQVKSLGENPAAFADAVAGTIDLQNYYFTSLGLRRATAEDTGITSASWATRQAQIEVPSNEIWMVRGVTSETQITTSAASEWVHTIPVLDLQVGDTIPLADAWAKDNFGTGQNTGRVATRFFDNPLFVSGGAKLFSEIWSWIGTTLTYDVRTKVLYYAVEK